MIVTFDYALADAVNLVVMFYFYDGPTPPSDVFAEYDKIPYISSSTKTQSYPDLLKANNEFSLQGLRCKYIILHTAGSDPTNQQPSDQLREATYPNLPHANMTAFYDHYWQTYNDFAFSKSLSNLDIQVLSFAIQPIPVGLQKASNDAGGNRLGLDPAHGDIIFMEHDISWINPVCDDRCPGYIQTLVDQLQDYERRTFNGMKPTHYQSGDVDFVSHNPMFMNDGQIGQNILQSYGADTYARMKQIQRQRDPKGFFSVRQGGFTFNT